MPHIFACGEMQLLFLQVELRLGKTVKMPGMIIMKMCQNNVLNRVCGHTKRRHTVYRTMQKLSSAPGGNSFGKAGVDHHMMIAAAGQPDKIIHRHRPVMRVAANKMFASFGITHGIADSIELIDRQIILHGESIP